MIAPWRDPVLLEVLGEARDTGLAAVLLQALALVLLVAAGCAVTVLAWAAVS